MDADRKIPTLYKNDIIIFFSIETTLILDIVNKYIQNRITNTVITETVKKRKHLTYHRNLKIF